MGIKQKIGKLLKLTDFFNSRELLRFDRQNDYRTVTGGFISLVIIVIIIAGFARMISDTLNLSIITYTLKTSKQTNPTQTIITSSPEKNFMFGIEIGSWGLQYQRFNLSSQLRFFDIQVLQYQLESAKIISYSWVDLEKCNTEHWKSIQDTVQNFQKLNIDKWLCPKIGQNFSIGGKYISSKSSTVEISVSPCRNQTDPTRLCASPDQIDKFFIDNGQKIYFTVYYINTIINPDQPTYITYYLEDMDFVIFGRKAGMQSYLYFSDYQIKSDFSIWPFEDIKYEKGFLVDEKPVQYPYYIFNNETKYMSFFFTKGANSYEYRRQVQKISSVFSFIGGLIGAIVAALFFVNSFTNYSYEISLARMIFQRTNLSSQNGQAEKQKLKVHENVVDKPNLFQYIKFGFYQLRKFFCNKVDWSAMEEVQLYLNEITNQLDVKYVVKRLIFIQFCIQHILEDYQLSELKLNLPKTLKKFNKQERNLFLLKKIRLILKEKLNLLLKIRLVKIRFSKTGVLIVTQKIRLAHSGIEFILRTIRWLLQKKRKQVHQLQKISPILKIGMARNPEIFYKQIIKSIKQIIASQSFRNQVKEGIRSVKEFLKQQKTIQIVESIHRLNNNKTYANMKLFLELRYLQEWRLFNSFQKKKKMNNDTSIESLMIEQLLLNQNKFQFSLDFQYLVFYLLILCCLLLKSILFTLQA